MHQAEETLRAYASISETEFPGQTTKNYYEALHAYLSAIALLDGIKTAGTGAHKDLIRHAWEEDRLSGAERALMEQLRKKRNALVYEGEPITKEFLLAKKSAILHLLEKLERQLHERLT